MAAHLPYKASWILLGYWSTHRSVVSADSRKQQKHFYGHSFACASFYLSAALSFERSLAGARSDTGSPFRTRKGKKTDLMVFISAS